MEDQRTLRSIRDFDDQVARTERERKKEQWLASQPTPRTLTVARMAITLIASPHWPRGQEWGATAAVKVATEVMVAAESSAAKERELQEAVTG